MEKTFALRSISTNASSRPWTKGKLQPKKDLITKLEKSTEKYVNKNTKYRNCPSFSIKVLKIPTITSKSWVVYDSTLGNKLFGKKIDENREVASLTKIMTFYTVLKYSQDNKIDFKNSMITISKEASKINGTRAELKQGDKLSVWDMLFAMMLPSGNDAALALAQYFGKLIFFNGQIVLDASKDKDIDFVSCFVSQMNINASILGLTNTHFNNPHGLSDENNKSTAVDIALLSSYVMKEPIFRQVVNSKYHSCVGFNVSHKLKHYEWKNTNLLLKEGFNGIKTGITPNAGPCLSCSILLDKRLIIIVLLDAESMEKRWEEAKSLISLVEKSKINFNENKENIPPRNI